MRTSAARRAHDAAPLATVRIRERVRWSDVDKMNVVFYGKYLRFVEIAESELFRTLGFTYDRLAQELRVWVARVHLSMDFRAPARLDDELECAAMLVRTGGSSLHFRFSIDRLADGVRVAEVTLVLACLDRDSLRSVRIPPPLAAAVAQAALAESPPSAT